MGQGKIPLTGPSSFASNPPRVLNAGPKWSLDYFYTSKRYPPLKHSSLQIEISPSYYSPRCLSRLWWHFLIPKTILEFYQGEAFHSGEVYCGQVLQHKKKKQTEEKQNMSTYCLYGVIHMSERHGSPHLSQTGDANTLFLANYPLPDRSVCELALASMTS